MQIYLLARAVQKIPEFRMDQVNDELGYWEILHPSYTILNKETKTFSSIWTPFDENFAQFYKSCVADIETFSKSKEPISETSYARKHVQYFKSTVD